MINKVTLSIILILISISMISCAALSDSQIIEAANKHASARGLHLQNYEISIAPPAHINANMPAKIKSIANAAAVTYTPKTSDQSGYTFYIDKNNGSLVLVMKRK